MRCVNLGKSFFSTPIGGEVPVLDGLVVSPAGEALGSGKGCVLENPQFVFSTFPARADSKGVEKEGIIGLADERAGDNINIFIYL